MLLLGDAIDAFWPMRLARYKEKSFKSASQAGSLFTLAESDERITQLCAALAAALGERVSGVAASARLKDSPAMLVAAETGPDLAMQRMLRRAGRPIFGPKPTLEINPEHKLIQRLAGLANLEEEAGLLLDLAILQEGDMPEDPASFVRRIADAIAGG